jgi:hypothetical protein
MLPGRERDPVATAYAASASTEFQCLKPLLQEWIQHEEEERERVHAALMICQGC